MKKNKITVFKGARPARGQGTGDGDRCGRQVSRISRRRT
jgi:hypothetical protein